MSEAPDVAAYLADLDRLIARLGERCIATFGLWRDVLAMLPSAKLLPWEFGKGGKHPLPEKAADGKGGFRRATRDGDLLTAWSSRWPAALLGAVFADIGCVDVDADKDEPDKDPPGIDAARRLAQGAPEGRSAGGGYHLWVQCPDDKGWRCNRAASKMAPGVEWRGPQTGFIALTLSDLRALTLPLPLPPVTPLLSVLVLPSRTPAPAPSRTRTAAPLQPGQDRGAATLLARACERLESATPGSREPALNSLAFLAGRLAGAGRLDTALEAAIRARAGAACGSNGASAKYGGEPWFRVKWEHGKRDGRREPLPSRPTPTTTTRR